MTIRNLTPHPIVLRDVEGVDHTIPPSGVIPRVSATPGELVDLGLPVPVALPDTVGEVVDLPAPEEGVFLIVSGFVGAAVQGRTDILVPGTGPKDDCIRNDRGHIVAVTRLKRV